MDCRQKSGSGLHPTFCMYLNTAGGRFLMAARRRKKSKTSNFCITLDYEDLDAHGDAFFAKLRSNYFGTEYVLYDSGKRGDKAKK